MTDVVGGRYLLLSEGGDRSGGSAIVRKAIRTDTGETVAIKFVMQGADDVVRKLFEREVTLLRQSQHPNIVRYIDSGIDDTGTQFLVLPWVESTIRDVIDSREPMPWEEFVPHVLRPIADAIAYLHRIDIEHRDIKTQNVLAEPDGNPLLADFGIAKLHREQGDTTLTVANIRTPLWAPPEFASAQSFLRDVFALGVMLIDGMTERSKRATEFHQLDSALERIDLPCDVRVLISDAIHVDPSKRPRNAIEFLRRLDRAVDAQRPAARKSRFYLGLTNRARDLIVGESGFRDKAGELLSQDLADETWASFRWDSDLGRHDPEVLQVIGTEMVLTVKRDARRGTLAVTSVKRPDYDALERMRERALRVDSFISWTTSSPLRISDIQTSYELLSDRVAEHHERAAEETTPEGEGHELLASWRRLLEARESIVSERLGVIEFVDSESRSARETTFTLLAEREDDLLGTEWQILDERQHVVMRGAIVQQSGTSLSVRWQFGEGRIPSHRRQLHPYLGPTQTAINRQRDALQLLQDGGAANQTLLELLVDPGSASMPHDPGEMTWTGDLDESKQAAVRAAIGLTDCMLVAGPPGTGKTRFIAETVVQQLRKDPNSRILIVSQTHVAIDNALGRLVEAGVDGIVRIGRAESGRIAESVHELILDNQLEVWASEVRKRAEKHFEVRAEGAGISQLHLRTVMLLEEYISFKKNRIYLESRLPVAQAAQDQTASRLDLVEDPVELKGRIADALDREAEVLLEATTLLGDELSLPSRMSILDAEAAVALLLSQSDQAGETAFIAQIAGWLVAASRIG